jgi:hypothetical protein
MGKEKDTDTVCIPKAEYDRMFKERNNCITDLRDLQDEVGGDDEEDAKKYRQMVSEQKQRDREDLENYRKNDPRYRGQ